MQQKTARAPAGFKFSGSWIFIREKIPPQPPLSIFHDQNREIERGFNFGRRYHVQKLIERLGGQVCYSFLGADKPWNLTRCDVTNRGLPAKRIENKLVLLLIRTDCKCSPYQYVWRMAAITWDLDRNFTSAQFGRVNQFFRTAKNCDWIRKCITFNLMMSNSNSDGNITRASGQEQKIEFNSIPCDFSFTVFSKVQTALFIGQSTYERTQIFFSAFITWGHQLFRKLSSQES